MQDEPTPCTTDVRVSGLVELGDLAGAATLAISEHGPGLIGWLRTLTPSAEDADEVFAIVCERLWRALPTFVWPGSLRTWLYVTARNIVIDGVRHERRRQQIPLSQPDALTHAVRSTTAAYRKTGAKARLEELRQSLSSDDRTLLILRVDRAMPWREVAQIVGGGSLDDEALRKQAARCRKRFERIKATLRAQWEPDDEA